MNRTEKQNAVKGLSEKLQKAKGFVLADYCGLTVEQMTNLRRKLHSQKSSVSVVKNRLFKRALAELSIKGLDEFLKGPVAVTLAEHDPVAPVKALVEFAKDNEKLKLKAGFMDKNVLTLKMLQELSKLPSREVLLAKLLGSLNAPASNLVGVLSALPRQLVTVMNAIKEKKQ
jgi:large subunit ribosomal protein L10